MTFILQVVSASGCQQLHSNNIITITILYSNYIDICNILVYFFFLVCSFGYCAHVSHFNLNLNLVTFGRTLWTLCLNCMAIMNIVVCFFHIPIGNLLFTVPLYLMIYLYNTNVFKMKLFHYKILILFWNFWDPLFSPKVPIFEVGGTFVPILKISRCTSVVQGMSPQSPCSSLLSNCSTVVIRGTDYST